jgi:hypothetical protein
MESNIDGLGSDLTRPHNSISNACPHIDALDGLDLSLLQHLEPGQDLHAP